MNAPTPEGSAQLDAADALLGVVVDARYRIDGRLGQGGSGTVYLATQLAIDRPVALKVLRSDISTTEQTLARFRREARLLASTPHPHIVSLIDFGQLESGSLYLVMERVEGEALSAVLDRKELLEPELVLELLTQIAEGLERAHAHGVIHRDLKPSNIVVSEYGGRPFVKILDFGIAKAHGEEDITTTDAIIGSPRYMSPEQASSQRITPQSDLYSLGVVGYHMLTGAPPFKEDSPLGYVLAHATKPVAPPTRRGVRLRGPLVEAILTLLAKEPWRRPPSATELLRTLAACRSAPIDWSACGPPEETVDVRTPKASAEETLDDRSILERARTVARPRAPRPGRGWVAGLSFIVATAVGLALAFRAGDEPLGAAPGLAGGRPAVAEGAAAQPVPTPPEPDAVPPPRETGPAPELPATPARPPGPLAPEVSPFLRVTLRSQPRAAVYRGKDKLGMTPLEITWAGAEPPPTLVLKAADHLPFTRELRAEEAGTDVTLRLKERQQTSTLERPWEPVGK